MKLRMFLGSLAVTCATAFGESCMTCGADLEQDWFGCQGKSETRDQAIIRALKEGVAQVYGLDLQAQQGMEKSSQSQSTNVDGERHKATQIDSSLNEKISAETAGRVKKWTIVSEEQAGDFVKVHLHVKVINPRKDNVRTVMFMPVKVAPSLKASVIELEKGRKLTGKEIGAAVGEAMLGYLSGETDLRVRTPKGIMSTAEMTRLNNLMVNTGMSAQSELQTMGEVLTTDYLLSVEVKDLVYKRKVGFDPKAGKAKPNEKFALTLNLQLLKVKSGELSGSATVTAELQNKDIAKLRAKDEDVKLLDVAMEIFAQRLVAWAYDATTEK